jgi:superoxide dismutase, Fe-Mn family
MSVSVDGNDIFELRKSHLPCLFVLIDSIDVEIIFIDFTYTPRSHIISSGGYKMKHELPKLPYSNDALAPHISPETIAFHYGKHHLAYINKLNELLEGSELAGMPLIELIKITSGPTFNNAAQAFNHEFYWNSLSPKGGGKPTGDIADAINAVWGSFEAFREKFSQAAVSNFGSGWTWLTRNPRGQLDIVNTGNAGNPITEGHTPILTLDVWEHSYYVDYRNARAKYVEAFWNLVNWDFANRNL